MEDMADIVMVFGGTNDFDHGDAPIGTPQGRTPETFYGAMHYLCKGLIEKHPSAIIVFMTPLHRAHEKSRRGFYLKQYVEIIREVAQEYSLPVLDLYATAGIQPQIPVQKEMFTKDGLHPNDAGYERVFKRVEAFLKAL